jgi:hypothetical protein
MRFGKIVHHWLGRLTGRVLAPDNVRVVALRRHYGEVSIL